MKEVFDNSTQRGVAVKMQRKHFRLTISLHTKRVPQKLLRPLRAPQSHRHDFLLKRPDSTSLWLLYLLHLAASDRGTIMLHENRNVPVPQPWSCPISLSYYLQLSSFT
jgi:hypothetical protein